MQAEDSVMRPLPQGVHHLRCRWRGGRNVPANQVDLSRAYHHKHWHRIFGSALPWEASRLLEQAESIRIALAHEQTFRGRKRLLAMLDKRSHLYRLVYLERNEERFKDFAKLFPECVERGVAFLLDAAKVLWRWCRKLGQNRAMAERHLAAEPKRHRARHWPRRRHIIPRFLPCAV